MKNMNNKEYRKTEKDLIYLCRCALNRETPVERSYNLEQLYTLSKQHMLTSMIGFALDDAGIEDTKFKHALLQAQRKTIILNDEKRQVFEALDLAGIWHMALKCELCKIVTLNALRDSETS